MFFLIVDGIVNEIKMKQQNYSGIEPWRTEVPKSERFFGGNYVKVIDVYFLETRNVLNSAGIKKREKFFRFVYVLNNTRIPNKENASSLSFNTVVIPVEGVKRHSDLFRIRRAFEIQSCAIVNKSRAKTPKFQKQFEKIKLDEVLWSKWYPDLQEENADE